MEIKGNKRILIVEPPFYNLFGYERWYYPLTATLVGTYFEEQGHEVKVYDGDKPISDSRPLTRTETRKKYPLYEEALNDNENPLWNEARKVIQEFNPDVVGITSVSAKIDSANKIAKITKELFGKDVEVILGGPHVQGMLKMFPNYDFGSDYDKVVPFIDRLIDRKPNKKLLMNYENYSSKNLSSLLTETGCPGKCTFCCNSSEKSIVYRNLQSIKEEIEEIKLELEHEELLKIPDDCFFSNKKRFIEIGNIIRKSGLKFETASRIMALSRDKIENFIENGGVKLYVGVESGSQKILDNIQKKLDVDKVIERTKLLNDYGLEWAAFFIGGFPFEKLDDLKLTEEIAYKIEPTFISLNRFTPYPGTQIWKDYYINSNLKFRDLFQQNPNSIVKLSDDMEVYLEKMVYDFDKYNSEQSAKRCK